MNYDEMIKRRHDFDALSISQTSKICALNEKLKKFEGNITQSVIAVDKDLRAQVEDPDDLLVDYNIICEISFPMVPQQPAKDTPQWRSWPYTSTTGSDWTETLKGISATGSKLSDGNNYNSFWEADCPIGAIEHCWLFHILYAEFRMRWEDICLISALWSDLEITHHYCSEL